MRYFKLSEFDCPCCGQNEMNKSFLNRLDVARSQAGTAFIVNSGYRCEAHNKTVGSTSTNHTLGLAADIRCTSDRLRMLIVKALLDAGFNRIGIYQTFIHVDTNNKPFAMWR